MPSLTEVVAGRPEAVGETIDGDLARGARVIRCDLREADLRGSHGYVIDPRENEVTGLTIDLTGSLGLLAPFGLEVD